MAAGCYPGAGCSIRDRVPNRATANAGVCRPGLACFRPISVTRERTGLATSNTLPPAPASIPAAPSMACQGRQSDPQGHSIYDSLSVQQNPLRPRITAVTAVYIAFYRSQHRTALPRRLRAALLIPQMQVWQAF